MMQLLTMLTISKLTSSSVPYYYNPLIHNFGNVGLGGKFHANLAPVARRVIDYISYEGINIRQDILSEYREKEVLDFCCGIGDSTSDFGTGVDTSMEMLKVAKKLNNDKKFCFGNAENYKPSKEFDIVTCMFAFHEMPLEAQMNVIENGKKIAKEEFIIVDIASNYQPKEIMLSGEPYLLDYLDNINLLLNSFEKINYIDKHVNIWKYKK